jgi:hypothetical protein
VDSGNIRALKGDKIEPSAVNRGRPGTQHHLITDRHGTPLAVILSGRRRG